MGWGVFLDRVTGWLPILTPAQRRRANIAKLKKEIAEIESMEWTTDRAVLVTRKQRQLDKLLEDAANQ